MSQDLTFDITLLSLILATVSLIIAAFSFSRKEKVAIAPKESNGKDVDAFAILQEYQVRVKDLEGRLLDLKVHFEIFELKLGRGRILPRHLGDMEFRNPGLALPPDLKKNVGVNNLMKDFEEIKANEVGEGKDNVRIEILRVISEGQKLTANEIREKVGRTREHVSRTMNLLYHDGVVSRDVSSRPYSYLITETGRRELED